MWEQHMRKAIVAALVTLAVVLTVGVANAKSYPGDGTPVTAQVSGTYFPAVAEQVAFAFTGTLTADRFVEVGEQLILNATLTDDVGLFAPLPLAVVVVATPSVEPVTGKCTVQISTTNTFVDQDGFRLELIGQAAAFALGGHGTDPDLCRVVKTTVKDPSDEGAIAKALNHALGLK
jgi:hypothetical protein